MHFLKSILKRISLIQLLVIVFFGLLASRSLIFENGYFNMHDDLQMMRQLQMEKCFLDGQIPCRWVPDMGYGYGFPLFNFYPPLPYLVGEIFRLLQFSFVSTVKLTFALALIASGLTMYILSKEFFGKWGGVISAVFYIWAPYHSVDIYVRGAMNEAWALVWFPLILWFSYKLINSKSETQNKKQYSILDIRYSIMLALSWAGLLLSHNLMVLVFTPVFAAWCFMFWVKNKDWNKVLQFALSGLFAISLTAFFTIPAIFEQKYVHVDTLVKGYYEFIAHFATIGQLLFARYWGYGASIWGPNDGMPFQIGQIHWVLSLVILVFVILSLIKKKLDIQKDSLYVIFFSIAFAWFASFMAHQNSTPIWQHFKPLEFVQFPWRFLTLAIFGFSLVSGAVAVLFKKYAKIGYVAIPSLLILLVVINWNYFAPQFGKMGPLSDEQKFSGLAWNMQRTAGIFDYLPNTAKQNPKDAQNTLALIVEGKGDVTESVQGTNWAKFKLDLESNSVIRINLFEFPNWKIFVDGNLVKSYIPDDELYGRMYLDLEKGEHAVSLKLENTLIREVSNLLSIAAWMGLLGFTVLQFKLWKKK